jgi:hypothetical protein
VLVRVLHHLEKAEKRRRAEVSEYGGVEIHLVLQAHISTRDVLLFGVDFLPEWEIDCLVLLRSMNLIMQFWALAKNYVLTLAGSL